jgi:hypothetical protein
VITSIQHRRSAGSFEESVVRGAEDVLRMGRIRELSRLVEDTAPLCVRR